MTGRLIAIFISKKDEKNHDVELGSILFFNKDLIVIFMLAFFLKNKDFGRCAASL